ncbi:DUF2269 domain-containing protein [Pseudonocardia sp. GCM10023141]|uniref:DUF2269 domain-containing protein n=1 Tax=Pseudonocardia sp. GCM10023141 TaxID=3252653 RepID=UPI00361723EB
MTPRLRQFARTVHVVASVGWLGAVVGFLALAVAGLTAADVPALRAVYLAMDVIGWYVLVPFSVASLLTGLISSLGTRWGLLRHYWVLVKLVMNLFASTVLVLFMTMFMQPLRRLADAAATGSAGAELRSLAPIVHTSGALILLVAAAALSVYKPRGLTRHGQRTQPRRAAAAAKPTDVVAGGWQG